MSQLIFLSGAWDVHTIQYVWYGTSEWMQICSCSAAIFNPQKAFSGFVVQQRCVGPRDGPPVTNRYLLYVQS